MLNIVIPMAGAGSRFIQAGYRDPKPLISIHGVPMIRAVIQNLKPVQLHRFIFICQKKHLNDYGLEERFKQWASNSVVIELEGITEGAACTVLAAKSLIDNDEPLMIANSDQYVDANINRYLNQIAAYELDGLIMTMKANDPKWSFVGVGANGLVNRVVEKEVISDEATVGIYNFKRGCDFIASAEEMIKKNERVNGEFYVAPIYNRLISDGQRIGLFNIGFEGKGMYGLGIPSDLNCFLENPISQQVIASCK
ncbi:NTP transferase domain-containing protein [Polynucleobacter paneuropaeus]|nr:NTP transferase domain-containing protein [Polynucleobacter paneuropaeus]